MRKGITPVISIIILLLITVSLAGMGWTYLSGYYEAMISKTIKLVEGSAMDNEVMIMNIGTSGITRDDLTILVDGQEADILRMEPPAIAPKSSARIAFISPVGDSMNVRIMVPGNVVSYAKDMDVHLQDYFDTKDTELWSFSTHQSVPFDDGGNNVVRNTGTGSSWSASFRRRDSWIMDGRGATFEFKVDATDTSSHFMFENGNCRWCAHVGSTIRAQYRDEGTSFSYHTLIDPIKTDTWYVATLKVDDTNGFYMKVYEKGNPSNQGEFTYIMVNCAGRQWTFSQPTYRNNAYTDNYVEHR